MNDKIPCCIDCITFAICNAKINHTYNSYLTEKYRAKFGNPVYDSFINSIYARCTLIQQHTKQIIDDIKLNKFDSKVVNTKNIQVIYVDIINNQLKNTFMEHIDNEDNPWNTTYR